MTDMDPKMRKFLIIFTIVMCSILLFCLEPMRVYDQLDPKSASYVYVLFNFILLASFTFFLKFFLGKIDEKIKKFNEKASKRKKILFNVLFYFGAFLVGTLIAVSAWMFPASRTLFFVLFMIFSGITLFLWLFGKINLRWFSGMFFVWGGMYVVALISEVLING